MNTGFRSILTAAAMALAAFLVPAQASAGVNLLFELMPGNFINSSDIDGFSVHKTGPGYYYSDTVSGGGGWSPIAKTGISVDIPVVYIDLTGGAGYLYNAAFHSPMYLGDTALRFKLGRGVTLGAHCSIVGIDPTWQGLGNSRETDVKFEKKTGVMPGIVFSAGKTFSFLMSLDYLKMKPLKVTTSNGWVANRSELDVSGYMLQLGFGLRFMRRDDRR